jgi:CBS domain-containing protein
MLIRDIMIKDVITAEKSTSVKQCSDILFKRHIGAIIVVDTEKRVIGIVTESDIIRVIAQDIPLNNPIEAVMTTNIKTIKEDSTFGEAKELMRLYRIRRIPVINSEDKLVGLVSLRHVLDEFFELIPRTRTPS